MERERQWTDKETGQTLDRLNTGMCTLPTFELNLEVEGAQKVQQWLHNAGVGLLHNGLQQASTLSGSAHLKVI